METVSHETKSGPAEYPSFPAREPEVSRKSPGPRLQVDGRDKKRAQQPFPPQSSSPERPDDEGAAGGSGGGGGGAGSEIEGSVTCLVCRYTTFKIHHSHLLKHFVLKRQIRVFSFQYFIQTMQKGIGLEAYQGFSS